MSAPRPAPLASRPERRKYARKDVIGTQLLSADVNANRASALILDISESGMAVRLLSPLKSRSEATFSFFLPGYNSRLSLSAFPVWSDDNRAGVRFTRVPDATRAVLEDWMSSLPALSVRSGRKEPSTKPLDTNVVASIAPASPRSAADVAPQQDQLDTVASRARMLLCGTGAAIAWVDAGGMVCRASCGNAPPPGVRVEVTRGLSGECVRTAEIVRCDDTETDPRVDAEVCRQLDLRSVIIVPILGQSGMVGLLEVFSDKPRAFTERDVPTLRTLASQIAPRPAEPMRMPSKGPVTVSTSSSETASPALPAAGPRATPAPAPPMEALRQTFSSSPDITRSKRSFRPLTLAIVVVAILLAAIYFYFAYERDSGARSSSRGPSASSPSSPATVAPAAATASVRSNSRTADQEPGTSRRRPATASSDAARSEQSSDETREAEVLTYNLQPSTSEAVPPQPTAAPVQSSTVDTAEGPIAAPQLPASSTERNRVLLSGLPSGGPSVPSLSSTPRQSRTSDLKLIRRVMPKYPATALLARREGQVVLRLTVGADGLVKDTQVISGHRDLAQAAADAVKEWRYEPYRLDGKAVDATTQAVVNFSLTRKSAE